MKTTITFEIDSDKFRQYTDEHLAALWYVAQANPADISDRTAGDIAELIGREIISRWIRESPIPLWNHKGGHAHFCELLSLREQIKNTAQEAAQ